MFDIYRLDSFICLSVSSLHHPNGSKLLSHSRDSYFPLALLSKCSFSAFIAIQASHLSSLITVSRTISQTKGITNHRPLLLCEKSVELPIQTDLCLEFYRKATNCRKVPFYFQCKNCDPDGCGPLIKTLPINALSVSFHTGQSSSSKSASRSTSHVLCFCCNVFPNLSNLSLIIFLNEGLYLTMSFRFINSWKQRFLFILIKKKPPKWT